MRYLDATVALPDPNADHESVNVLHCHHVG